MVLFVFLLPVSLCHAASELSACFATDGTVIRCSDGKALPRAGNLNFENQPVGLAPDVQNDSSPTLTYAHLADYSFIPSEVIKSDYAQVIIVPTYVKSQEPFVSLKEDIREQVLWPWRDVVEDGPKKLHYNFSVEDVTGRGNVRVFNTKIGVEYEVSKNKAIGVEAVRGIQDAQDASAWGKSAKEEKAAQVKYKIFF